MAVGSRVLQWRHAGDTRARSLLRWLPALLIALSLAQGLAMTIYFPIAHDRVQRGDTAAKVRWTFLWPPSVGPRRDRVWGNGEVIQINPNPCVPS